MCAFVVLRLAFHTKPTDWPGNVSEMTQFLRVEWDVKPQLNQSTPIIGSPMLQAKLTSLSDYSMDVRRLFPLGVVSLRQ